MRVNRSAARVARAAAVVLAGTLAVGCGGGGGNTKAAKTAATDPSALATATTSGAKNAVKDVDVCNIITMDKFNAALGTSFDKPSTTGIISGGPTTDCSYTSSNGSSLGGMVNYLADDGYGTSHFSTEQKMQKGDASGDCSSASCYQDLSGLGDEAFAHVNSSSQYEIEVVAHKGDATLTVGVNLSRAGTDPKKAIAGLVQLAHLVFP